MRSLARRDRWLVVLVAVGLILRGYHNFRYPPVWHDEAAIVVNVLGLSFEEMFGPLIHAEAAPPLFLVAERLIVLVLGDGVLALRLLPILAACGSLLLVAGTARRVLSPVAAVLAVGLFAVSDRLLWHSCEAKSYSLDVFWAAAASYWFVRTDGWSLWRRCLPAALVAPLAIWTSFPACFVAGGLLVGWFPAAVRSGSSGRAAFLSVAASVGASFVVLALGPVAAQRCGTMEACWERQFADWSRPWAVPVWAFMSTFEVARYCLLPVGQPMLVFAAIGAAVVRRTRTDGQSLVATLLIPIGLALLAALLHKYPYGGARVVVFAAPAVCLLGAAGVSVALPAVARRSRVAAAVVLGVVLFPVALAGWVLIDPWDRPAADAGAGYVLSHRAAGEPVLVNHWEYEYYMRTIPGEWRLWFGSFEPAELETSGRIWVVHTGQVDGSTIPFMIPPGWEVSETQRYPQVAVFALARVPTGIATR
jgi:hypothetical protein